MRSTRSKMNFARLLPAPPQRSTRSPSWLTLWPRAGLSRSLRRDGPLQRWRIELHARLARCARLPSRAVETARAVLADTRQAIPKLQTDLTTALTSGAEELTSGGQALAEIICNDLGGQLDDWQNQLVKFMDDPAFDDITKAIGAISGALQSGAEDISGLVDTLEAEASSAIDAVAAIAEEKRAELGSLIVAADRAAAKAESVMQKGDRTLALMRAVGRSAKGRNARLQSPRCRLRVQRVEAARRQPDPGRGAGEPRRQHHCGHR